MKEFYTNLKKMLKDLYSYFPKASKQMLYKAYIEEESSSLQYLVTAFNIEEKQVVKENDLYQNGVIFMASLISQLLIKHYNDFRKNKVEEQQYVTRLLENRYIGYSFFKYRKNNIELITDSWVSLKDDAEIGLILYKSMLCFFKNYYGDFANNELAIEMICIYFPKGQEKNRKLSKLIADSIKSHFKNAGTIYDSGYAYGGIDKIEKYFSYLPLETVIDIIENSSLYELINNKIIRHQVWAAINGSNTDKIRKKKLKFFYLDSLIMANTANLILFEMYKRELNVNPYRLDYDVKIGDKKFGVLLKVEENSKEFLYGYWYSDKDSERSFFIKQEKDDEKKIISFSLNMLNNENEKIKIYSGNVEQSIKYKDFDYYDYSLFDLQSNEQIDRMEEFILMKNSYAESDGKIQNEKNHDFSFSYVYLDKYRTLAKQDIDFDHRFKFDSGNNSLIKNDELCRCFEGVYGKNIFSLSCIVGKNGTGKTSTIDFLRTTFFKVLKLVNEGYIKTTDGILEENSFEGYRQIYGDTKFLVVFKLNGVDYYLSNILITEYQGVIPFEKGGYKKDNDLSKIIFFSSALNISNPKLFWSVSANSKLEDLDKNYDRVLSNFRLMDYSEDKSFIVKHRMMDDADPMRERISLKKYFNKELFYQLFYISNVGFGTLSKQLGLGKDCQLRIISKQSEELIIDDSHIIYDTELLMDKYSNYIYQPESRISYLSAGQYAKLCLFSKFYWFLNGEEYFEANKNKFGANEFDEHAFLSPDESAMIFMDECELYLHPEWQRLLLSEWLNFIEKVENSNKIQFVMTTNSPFIISDILSEDVHYLPKESSKRVGTFAQNIHMLLRCNFFMENTIGEFSKSMIGHIMEALSTQENELKYIDYDKMPFFTVKENQDSKLNQLKNLIESIAEPIYRNQLLEMLYITEDWKKSLDYKDRETDRLNKIKELKLELKRLEGEYYDKA